MVLGVYRYRMRCLCWLTASARQPVWIVSNLLLALLFGVLHQGGVVPSLFRVHDMIYSDTTPTADQRFYVLYWKTYMPPRHLLAIPKTGASPLPSPFALSTQSLVSFWADRCRHESSARLRRRWCAGRWRRARSLPLRGYSELDNAPRRPFPRCPQLWYARWAMPDVP